MTQVSRIEDDKKMQEERSKRCKESTSCEVAVRQIMKSDATLA